MLGNGLIRPKTGTDQGPYFRGPTIVLPDKTERRQSHHPSNRTLETTPSHEDAERPNRKSSIKTGQKAANPNP